MFIYIDSDYKCRTTGDGAVREMETDVFNGKCRTYIEGYRFVPAGETWVREDGTAFSGEMIAPWKPYEELTKAQADWEHAQLAIVTAERDEILNQMQELIDEVLRGDEYV